MILVIIYAFYKKTQNKNMSLKLRTFKDIKSLKMLLFESNALSKAYMLYTIILYIIIYIYTYI